MPSANFHIIEGPDKGRIYRDLPLPTTIGREEGNGLRLNDARASRFHAKVSLDSSDIIITDLDSTNGTRLNGTPVQIRRLRPGDQIGIGRTILVFGTDEEIAARQENYYPLHQDRPTFRDVGAATVHQNGSRDRGDLLGTCAHLRELLETGSVFCTEAQVNGLGRAILGSEPLVIEILGRGFHRVVVADAARGLDGDRRFSSDLFLTEVCRSVGACFNLQLDPQRFHVEDVFQILKDELPSLFCFVHFECVIAESLRTARAFTQGVHRVLFLNDGQEKIPSEAGNEDSKVADVVRELASGLTAVIDPTWLSNQPMDEDIPPLPVRLSPAQAARLAEVFDYLERGLNAAIANANQDEPGPKVRLSFNDWQTILAIQMLFARYYQKISEPEQND